MPFLRTNPKTSSWKSLATSAAQAPAHPAKTRESRSYVRRSEHCSGAVESVHVLPLPQLALGGSQVLQQVAVTAVAVLVQDHNLAADNIDRAG